MKNKKIIALIAAGIILAGLSIKLTIESSKNKAISLEEQIETDYSDLQVQYKRREDLIYNLVDCVKSYDLHESNLLKDIVEGRGNKGDIENVSKNINIVAEAYPELKSNENYKNLMLELSTTENLISNYRSSYNKSIKEYNRYIKSFPTRKFLDVAGYDPESFSYLEFESSEEAPKDLFKGE